MQLRAEVPEVVAVQAVEPHRSADRAGRADRLRWGSRQPAPGGRLRSLRLVQERPRGAAPEQLAALASGPWPQVDQPVGGAGDEGVVFHHHHGLALVAQALEHLDQAAHIVGMKARRRFIQDDEQPAQLAQRQADELQPLHLPTGQGRRGAVKGQIPQPELRHQIAAGEEVRADGLQHPGLSGQGFHRGEVGSQFPNRQGGQVHDACPAPGHRQGFWPQARSVTGRAGGAADEAEDGVVPLAAQDLFHDGDEPTVEAILARPGGDAGPLQARFQWVLAVGDLQTLRSVQHHLARFVAQVPPRDVHGAAMGAEHLVQHLQGHLRIHQVAVRRADPQRAVSQGLGGIGHQQVQVQAVLHAQALALGAGAGLAVEGEEPPAGVDLRGGRAQPREEQAQEVPHLGEGAHGGARIGEAGALAHGHGGSQALDAPHGRARQAAHELPCVGGQRLQEAALAFPEQRVEGEGGLAGPGHTGDRP